MDTVKVNNPSWKIVCEIGEAKADGTMPTDMKQLGWILEDSFSPNHTEGEEVEVKDTEGEVRFSRKKPPVIGWNATIIGIPDEMKGLFWDTEKKNEKFNVNSFSNNKEFAVRIYDKTAIGSEMHEYPRVTISMGMGYTASDGGFTSEMTMKMLKPTNAPIMYIGTVGAPTTGGE